MKSGWVLARFFLIGCQSHPLLPRLSLYEPLAWRDYVSNKAGATDVRSDYSFQEIDRGDRVEVDIWPLRHEPDSIGADKYGESVRIYIEKRSKRIVLRTVGV